MPKVFISYRRDDSQAISDRIYERLVRALGDRQVFKDVDDIPFGRDFRTVLNQRVAESDVLLVVIGKFWADIAYDDGRPRLMDADDFVRIEVESGLTHSDMLVVPVLVNGAAMPAPEKLPESLRTLVYRNAIKVRNDPDFKNDIERLINYLRRVDKERGRPANGMPRSGGRGMLVGGAVVAFTVIVIALLALSGVFDGNSDDGDTTPEPGQTQAAANSTDMPEADDPTATATMTPTSTVTPTPTRTPTTTPTRTESPEPVAIPRLPINIRGGDTTDYPVIATSAEDIQLSIIGVSSTGSGWYFIRLPDGRTGWVAPSAVRVTGNVDSLPLAEPPSLDSGEIVALDPHDFNGLVYGAGSSYAGLLVEPALQDFGADGFEGEIMYGVIGSGAGFESLCYGETSFTTSSRPMRDSEVELCDEAGYSLQQFTIGFFAIVIAIHPDNDWAGTVTYEELAQILATAETWNDVNPDWPNEPIVRFLPQTDTATFGYLVDSVVSETELLTAPNIQLSDDNNVLINGVQSDIGGIGVFVYPYIEQIGYTGHLLTLDGVYPDTNAITTEEYTLTAPLTIYSALEIMENEPQIAGFINYLLRYSDEAYANAGIVKPNTIQQEENNALWRSLAAALGY